jgi:hypothetical protein
MAILLNVLILPIGGVAWGRAAINGVTPLSSYVNMGEFLAGAETERTRGLQTQRVGGREPVRH